ncbi:hypothetical protein AB6A40_004538 [Gnathostoma spinigerum]|uniref:Uncharacterized protein n=1 Tax=Gnathostoma spinigerum TaxID=75299 RepID=A0ABD6EI46_9BILA
MDTSRSTTVLRTTSRSKDLGMIPSQSDVINYNLLPACVPSLCTSQKRRPRVTANRRLTVKYSQIRHTARGTVAARSTGLKASGEPTLPSSWTAKDVKRARCQRPPVRSLQTRACVEAVSMPYATVRCLE